MATFKLLLHSANKRKDGSYPVSLRITKNMKHKYVSSLIPQHYYKIFFLST